MSKMDRGLQPPDLDHNDDDKYQRIAEWVARYLSIEDAFPSAEILTYVQKAFNPDDVFSQEELQRWAISKGYLKTQI